MKKIYFILYCIITIFVLSSCVEKNEVNTMNLEKYVDQLNNLYQNRFVFEDDHYEINIIQKIDQIGSKDTGFLKRQKTIKTDLCGKLHFYYREDGIVNDQSGYIHSIERKSISYENSGYQVTNMSPKEEISYTVYENGKMYQSITERIEDAFVPEYNYETQTYGGHFSQPYEFRIEKFKYIDRLLAKDEQIIKNSMFEYVTNDSSLGNITKITIHDISTENLNSKREVTIHLYFNENFQLYRMDYVEMFIDNFFVNTDDLKFYNKNFLTTQFTMSKTDKTEVNVPTEYQEELVDLSTLVI